MRRANFILAGYLHEAIKVVLAVKGRYLGDPAFERLRLLALGKEYGKARYYVRKIRNCAAFHLDENDAVTRSTLAKLKPTSMRFACGDDLNQLDVYYEFTDLIDYEFIYNEVSRGRTRQETNDDLSKTIRNFADEFMDAANTFQEALADKFELKNYVY